MPGLIRPISYLTYKLAVSCQYTGSILCLPGPAALSISQMPLLDASMLLQSNLFPRSMTLELGESAGESGERAAAEMC